MTVTPSLSGFQVEGCLLETSTCTIWRATQVALDRTILMLALKEEISASPPLRIAAFTSVRLLSKARSGLFPDIIDIFHKDGIDYIILEDANSTNILSLLNGQCLNPEQLFTLAIKLAESFSELHASGLVYCSFSPARFFITEDSTPILPDITSLIQRGTTNTLSHIYRLTPADLIWASPEQCDPNTPALDGRSDIFSVAMTLYALATGEIPFGRLAPADILIAKQAHSIVSPCDIRPQFPIALATILSKMAHRDPALRYGSWDEVLVDLYQAQQGITPEFPDLEYSIIAPPKPKAQKQTRKPIRLSMRKLRAYQKLSKKKSIPIIFWVHLVAGLLTILTLTLIALLLWKYNS